MSRPQSTVGTKVSLVGWQKTPLNSLTSNENYRPFGRINQDHTNAEDDTKVNDDLYCISGYQTKTQPTTTIDPFKLYQ